MICDFLENLLKYSIDYFLFKEKKMKKTISQQKETLSKKKNPAMERKTLKYIRLDKDVEYQINLYLLDKNRQAPQNAKKITFGEFVEECVNYYFKHQINNKEQTDE